MAKTKSLTINNPNLLGPNKKIIVDSLTKALILPNYKVFIELISLKD